MSEGARVRRGVLDTSVIIDLEAIEDRSRLPLQSLVTIISLAELSVGPQAARTDEERAIRQARLEQVETMFELLPFDLAAARAFGHVVASLRRAGRKPTARALDALIASIAIAHSLPLYTCNADDFRGIDGLTVFAVPRPP